MRLPELGGADAFAHATGADSEDRLDRMERLIEAISDCMPAVGTEDFTGLFMRVVTLTGAGQATAIAYDSSGARCLISRNFLHDETSGTLAAAYVDGWFREDPLSTG